VGVTEQLVAEACASLGVRQITPLRDGGQKTVRLVEGADGEQLVLKVVSVGGSSPDALRRSQREVELLQHVDSHHVVRVRSDLIELGDPTTGVAWLEEYLDGDDLADVVGTAWTWADAARLGEEVALGLAELHSLRVVHRDLSARNVRRLSDGTFKIMDPGFARHELRSGLTIGGHPGTPGFASPEHVRSYSAGPTAFSDVFCVGILVYLALAGDVPIPYKDDLSDYLHRLSGADVADLSAVRPDLTPEQIALVRRCLHSQPARRPKDGSELASLFSAQR